MSDQPSPTLHVELVTLFPELFDSFLSASLLGKAIEAGLVAVVTHGTAASIQMPGLAVAGKTGTAENPHGRPHAWFAGYAPVKDPQLVVVALVENAGYGAEFAAPIVQRVLQVAFGLPVPGARPLPAPAAPPPPPAQGEPHP